MKTLVSAVIAATLASAFAVAPAQAEGVRVAVKSAGLDLNSATGAATIANRIETRVNQACAASQGNRDLKGVELCKDALLSDAAEQLTAKGAPLAAAKLAANG